MLSLSRIVHLSFIDWGATLHHDGAIVIGCDKEFGETYTFTSFLCIELAYLKLTQILQRTVKQTMGPRRPMMNSRPPNQQPRGSQSPSASARPRSPPRRSHSPPAMNSRRALSSSTRGSNRTSEISARFFITLKAYLDSRPPTVDGLVGFPLPPTPPKQEPHSQAALEAEWRRFGVKFRKEFIPSPETPNCPLDISAVPSAELEGLVRWGVPDRFRSSLWFQVFYSSLSHYFLHFQRK